MNRLKLFLCGIIICTATNIQDWANPAEVIEHNFSQKQYNFKLIKTKTIGLQALIISTPEKVISNSEYFVQGYFINGFLNANMNYDAINNRHSIGGDYVWIFSLPCGCAIKQPDNENVKLQCLNVEAIFPKYSYSHLGSHFSFAYRWKSLNELLVCTILISDQDHDGILTIYDTYTIGKYGGYSITDRKIEKLSPPQFKTLPETTPSFWAGWNSTWWSSPGTMPEE